MTRRRAIVVAVLALVTVVLHVVLVRSMAHGHVAHVLLGSGNAAPPLGAAVLAISLVLVRVGAVVVAPGALLAAAASLLAHVLVGPPRGGSDPEARSQRDGRRRSADGAGTAPAPAPARSRAQRLGLVRGRGRPRPQHRGPRDVVVAVDRVPGCDHADRAENEHAKEHPENGMRGCSTGFVRSRLCFFRFATTSARRRRRG